jgi:hypothetical protein
MNEAMMSADGTGTAGMNDATREALARMDAARELVRRRWFSPEAMAVSLADVPEVVGSRVCECDPEYRRWRDASCTREQ